MRWRDENKAPEAAQSSAFPDRVFLSTALLGDDGSQKQLWKPEGLGSERVGSKVTILYFHGCSALVSPRGPEPSHFLPVTLAPLSPSAPQWKETEPPPSGGMFTQT